MLRDPGNKLICPVTVMQQGMREKLRSLPLPRQHGRSSPYRLSLIHIEMCIRDSFLHMAAGCALMPDFLAAAGVVNGFPQFQMCIRDSREEEPSPEDLLTDKPTIENK